MNDATILGIFLKVETRGWTGPAPHLPKAPVKIEAGAEGLQRFIYELTPKEEHLSVQDACQRLASRIERIFSPERTPFREGNYALRCTLDVGILVIGEASSFSYAWPLDFLQAIADAQLELTVSHYLPSAA